MSTRQNLSVKPPSAAALDTYHEMAGWDKRTGNPTKEKLAELGLEWVS